MSNACSAINAIVAWQIHSLFTWSFAIHIIDQQISGKKIKQIKATNNLMN